MNRAFARTWCRRLIPLWGLAILPGCAVVGAAASVAGAAVSVASTVVVTTVSVTGKVIEKTVDLATADEQQP
ncbi:hypothetical protein [Aquabacterium sp.]|uniref:hypothetical protein n=1 Tax=Aquabacterium sp. TaxID=1872578 RepID=UPI00248955C1|nr:hypothetical protein [Aquabacterium sp.]MDI1258216.1 hypothetical protein [Aquabacterium sp.]